MDMDGHMGIATKDLLTLTQILSPSFPVGAYAYSHGVEAAIDAGWVKDANSLRDWISDLMRHGGIKSDAIFLAAAYLASSDGLVAVDAEARAFTGSSERLKESGLQGAAFCTAIENLWGFAHSQLTYPVAVGAAAKAKNLPLEPVISAYAHAFVSNLVAVGMRAVPIGQSDGQNLIQELHELCIDLGETCAHGDQNQITSQTILSDIAAMRHETQYSRIFRT